MESVWLKVVNQSLSVSIVILAVLLVRGIFMRKVPKKYVFFLWAVVGLRLLIPVGITDPLHWPGTAPHQAEQMTGHNEKKESAVQEKSKEVSADNTEKIKNSGENQKNTMIASDNNQTEKSKMAQNTSSFKCFLQIREKTISEKVIQVTAYLWLAGMLLFGIWNVCMYVRMKKQLQQAVLYKEHIYECDKIGSPFVMGLLHPTIYIPFRLREEELSYIVKHEQYHIKRKDYLTKFVAGILTGIYWFHPLVWVAYFLMVRDMEMSCDEYVVQTMGNKIKKEYSTSLLAFATNKRNVSMGMLAFGESGTRKRVKHILQLKKTAKWVGVVGVVLVFVTGIVCFVASNIGEPIKNEAKGVGQETEKKEKVAKKEKAEKKQKEIEEGNVYRVNADVTGDGIADEIWINISNEVIQPFTEEEEEVVNVISGATGKVVYTMGNFEDISLTHPAYNSLYLYHGKDKDYLLNWNPAMYQGMGTYGYEIFTVTESGEKESLEKEQFSFDLGKMSKKKIQKYKDFIEKVNDRLEHSEILISTLNGELITYNDLEEHLLLFDSSDDLDSMGALNR